MDRNFNVAGTVGGAGGLPHRPMRWMSGLVWIACAGLLAGCPVTQSQETPVPARSVTEPQTGHTYWLYVPSYYRADRYWPMVVTLHGSKVWDGPQRQMMEWKALAEQHGFLVIAPTVPSAEGILPVMGRFKQLAEDEKAVLADIDQVSAQYQVDSQAILLTGFSAGGYPLYYIGLRNPARFNALIARACDSSLDILESIELTDAVRKMPIRIFWGKDDLSVIQKESWQAFRWLREHRCFNTTMKEVRGGHLRRPEQAYRFWLATLPAHEKKLMR
jgi:poly(3-hydroxybutyrate) depolymerase